MIQHADPLPTGGTGKPGTLSALRPDRIGQLHRLLDGRKSTHGNGELECIREHCDAHGSLMRAFLRSPHPVILGEWIQPASSGELHDLEGMIFGYEMFHVSVSMVSLVGEP